MAYDEIYARPLRPRMEEEEEISSPPRRRPVGIRVPPQPVHDEEVAEQVHEHTAAPNPRLIEELIQERRTIIASEKFSTRDKFRLLESNRMALAVASGTTAVFRKTENVVYAILLFGGVVLITLALMNRFTNLPERSRAASSRTRPASKGPRRDFAFDRAAAS